MKVLTLNDGRWNYPTSAELAGLTRRLAAVLTRSEVTNFLLEAPRRLLSTLLDGNQADLDAALWAGDSDDPRRALLSVVHLDNDTQDGPARVFVSNIWCSS